MSNAFELAEHAAKSIREKSGIDRFDIVLCLGSGWLQTLNGKIDWSIEATEIPGFRKAEVEGFSSQISSIKLDSGKHVLVLPRTHLYQGYGVEAVAHPARTAAALGAKVLLLTNGAGGLNSNWHPGQVFLISDHINLTATSPIEGAKFVDLTDMYSPRLRALAKQIEPSLEEVVYAQFRGPHYESPAEVKMVGIVGGHMVGMSTALETIAAREVGLEVLALSMQTNPAAGVVPGGVSHENVLAAGKVGEHHNSELLAKLCEAIGDLL
ncbi:MAG: purine-nucleoside phosphorylase [Micrococcales bacterium]